MPLKEFCSGVLGYPMTSGRFYCWCKVNSEWTTTMTLCRLILAAFTPRVFGTRVERAWLIDRDIKRHFFVARRISCMYYFIIGC